jgi:hypothetical protein
MVRHLFLLSAGLLVTAGPATAQYPYPYQQPGYANPPGGMAGPPLSPYLNLLNGGNPAVNYYNFVRPQLQLQQQQLYGGGGTAMIGEYPLASALPTSDWTARIPRPTGSLNGNPAAYMAYGPYFNSMGTIGSAARGQPSAARPAQSAVPNVPRR